MTKEELDLRLKQELPPSISFEGYYTNIALEGEPPCFGWNYCFVQGDLLMNTVILEKILPKLSLRVASVIVKMVKSAFAKGLIDRRQNA